MRILSQQEVVERGDELLAKIRLASPKSPAAEPPECLLAWVISGAAEFWELECGWAIVAERQERDGKNLLFVLVEYAANGMASGLLEELPAMEEEARKRGCTRASFMSVRPQWEKVAPRKFGYRKRVVEYVKEF